MSVPAGIEILKTWKPATARHQVPYWQAVGLLDDGEELPFGVLLARYNRLVEMVGELPDLTALETVFGEYLKAEQALAAAPSHANFSEEWERNDAEFEVMAAVARLFGYEWDRDQQAWREKGGGV